jgi:hypothetical protein
MSWPGRVALFVLLVAAIVVGVAAYREPHNDAQDALVISAIVLWTLVAAGAIVIVDLLAQVIWRRLTRLRREVAQLDSSPEK